MTATVTLGSHEFEAALAVLEREQLEHMPSRWQYFFYRLFSWSIHLFAAVAICNLIAILLSDLAIDLDAVIEIAFMALAIMSLAIIVLFFLNLGLMWKLVRQARLRRRLRLAASLRAAFKARRRSERLQNVLTALIAGMGVLFVPASAFLLVVFILFFDLRIRDLWDEPELLAVPIVGLIVGLSLVFLHFMRRGKERLEVVTSLQASLRRGKQVSEAPGDAALEISVSEYDKIAQIERAHIIADRAQSIKSGHKEARDSSYLVQTSRTLASAKAQLDADVRSSVDEQIQNLMTDPRPPGVATDPETGHLQVRVPDTPVSILYDVDDAGHRIRLFTLTSSAAA